MYKNKYSSTVFIYTLIFAALSLAKPTLEWWNTTDTLTWNSLPNTPQATSYTAGAYVNGYYYQISGQLQNYYMSPYMQKFNGSTWSLVGQHPFGGLCMHSATVWNEKIIVSGGYTWDSPGHYDYSTIFDPSYNSWMQSTPMPVASMWQTAMVSVNNKCYLLGGRIGTTNLNTVYFWTPGDANMVSRSPLPDARSALTASVHNGNIYVFGGYNGGYKNTIFMYNPTNNNWVIKSATINPACGFAAAVTIGDLIYIIGGYSGSSVLNNVQIYNPINDTILSGPPLLFSTWGHGAAGTMIPNGNCTTYTGKIYVSGGSSIPSGDPPTSTANLGTVAGVNPVKVEPTSLGNLKALYH